MLLSSDNKSTAASVFCILMVIFTVWDNKTFIQSHCGHSSLMWSSWFTADWSWRAAPLNTPQSWCHRRCFQSAVEHRLSRDGSGPNRDVQQQRDSAILCELAQCDSNYCRPFSKSYCTSSDGFIFPSSHWARILSVCYGNGLAQKSNPSQETVLSHLYFLVEVLLRGNAVVSRVCLENSKDIRTSERRMLINARHYKVTMLFSQPLDLLTYYYLL